MRKQLPWRLAITMTVLWASAAIASGAAPEPVADWRFDEEAKEEEAVLVYQSSLVAADARTAVVQSGQALESGPPLIAADVGGAADCRIETVSEDASRKTIKVRWQQIDLGLPATARNQALASAGAKFSASSGKVTLGAEPDRNARLSQIQLRWQDQSAGQYPDWVAVRFPEARPIDTVVVRTLGEHVRGRNREGIRDWQIQCRTPGGNWTTVAAVQNSTKEVPYIYTARAGTRQIGSMHRLAADYQYFMFNKPCARWLPLLEACDRYGRPRGSAGAMILNHDGWYRGSLWALFGVTNRDLFPAGDAAAGQALVDVVNFALRGALLHGCGRATPAIGRASRPRSGCWRPTSAAPPIRRVSGFSSCRWTRSWSSTSNSRPWRWPRGSPRWWKWSGSRRGSSWISTVSAASWRSTANRWTRRRAVSWSGTSGPCRAAAPFA